MRTWNRKKKLGGKITILLQKIKGCSQQYGNSKGVTSGSGLSGESWEL